VSKEIKLFTGDNVAFILVNVNRENPYIYIYISFLAIFRYQGFSVITTGTSRKYSESSHAQTPQTLKNSIPHFIRENPLNPRHLCSIQQSMTINDSKA